jgi:hypothetical protein
MTPLMNILKNYLPALLVLLLLAGCSTGKMVVRGSQSIMDSSLETMNRETDLELARQAMPANLKLLEGMLVEDPGNTVLRLYAAQGFYGYAYGFIELEDPLRAAQLYRRCYDHARIALTQTGVKLDPEHSTTADFEAAVSQAGKRAVPGLFWTASCLSNWINLNRDRPAGIAELSSAAVMMQRVLDLDETFYHGGAHMFFGVYYGGRSPMFGGNFEQSEYHFRRATEINSDRLLLVDLLYAEYLARQRLDQVAFHNRLTRVIEAPADLYPEMALVNEIARVRAAHLLEHENDWF